MFITYTYIQILVHLHYTYTIYIHILPVLCLSLIILNSALLKIRFRIHRQEGLLCTHESYRYMIRTKPGFTALQ